MHPEHASLSGGVDGKIAEQVVSMLRWIAAHPEGGNLMLYVADEAERRRYTALLGAAADRVYIIVPEARSV